MRPDGLTVLGFALMLLSLHPVVVEALGWAIPIQEQAERPLFASLALALAGLSLVAYVAVEERVARRRRSPPAPPAGDVERPSP